ncbi:hypothetical protein NHH82_16515 [Oxalobacteraceae bacterium OTU3REALA1]|nr:hypothetical protein NHH82_16515 [Oxalobacteraceae bacterium OTU3REALA1]
MMPIPLKPLPCAIFAVLQLYAGICQAQQLAYSSAARPTVSRASDFIAVTAVTTVGKAIKFARLDSTDAKRLLSANLQVRIFPLGQGQDVPVARHTIEDCNLYLTTIFPVDKVAGGDVMITTPDAGWLSLSTSERSYAEGNYYIVFETTGADDRVFRLNTKDTKNYFDQGFKLTVKANESISIEQVRQHHVNRNLAEVELVKRVDLKGNAIPCYRYASHRTVLAEIDEQMKTGELLACQ